MACGDKGSVKAEDLSKSHLNLKHYDTVSDNVEVRHAAMIKVVELTGKPLEMLSPEYALRHRMSNIVRCVIPRRFPAACADIHIYEKTPSLKQHLC